MTSIHLVLGNQPICNGLHLDPDSSDFTLSSSERASAIATVQK